MQLPVARWLDAVATRRSRRAYDGRPLAAEDLAELDALCRGFIPWLDARAVLVEQPEVDVFRGLLGSYGKIHGAPSVVVFVARSDGDGPALRHLGYVGEGVVLEATARGLGTCWVSGFFDAGKARKLVELAAGDRVVAVTPLGHPLATETQTERVMQGVASSHNRKPLDEIAPGHRDWPTWAQKAAACARLAPSATNRQPWRFAFEDGDFLLCRNSRRDLPRTSKWLDLGIASLHVELAARAEGVEGSWIDAAPGTTGLELCRYHVERG